MTNQAVSKSDLGRYLLATILPIIFLCFSLALHCYDQFQLYQFTKTEIEGVQTIKTLYQALTDLQKIRGLSQIAHWGQHAMVKRELAELKQRFLARFQDAGWRNHARMFDLEKEARLIVTKARSLFLLDPSEKNGLEQLFDAYSELITDILQLMQLAASHSNLILDPELDTYYLIDVLDLEIPYLAEAIGRVRGMGSGLLAKKEISQQEKEKLHAFHAAIQARMESIRNAQNIIFKTSAKLKNSLELLPPDLNRVMAPLLEECLCIEGKIECPDMPPEDFFQLATRAIDLLSIPYEKGIVVLTSRFSSRQVNHLWHGALIFVGTSMAIGLLLYFNRAFYLYDQKLHQKMEKLSITDQLTGLYNRRHFYTVFPRELRKALRHGEHLFVGLIDVDNFKRFNDTYGHPEGDKVLHAIAATMQGVLQRAGDYCFRIGGEEFCFLISEKEHDRARLLTERLLQAIVALDIEHTGNPPYNIVTVSIGLCQVPEQADAGLEQVMARVDQALYEAKKRGRNRVVFFKEETTT
jgi:diguanylate cyclase (GGDEF)-like protein